MYPWSDCEPAHQLCVLVAALASSLVPPYELSHGRLSLRERQLISTRVLTCYHLGRIGILGGCKLEVAHAYQRVVQIPVYADGRVRLGLPILLLAGTTAALLGLPWPALTAPLLPPASSGSRQPARPTPWSPPATRCPAPWRTSAARLWEHRRTTDAFATTSIFRPSRKNAARHLRALFEGAAKTLPGVRRAVRRTSSHQREATFLKKTVQIRQELAERTIPPADRRSPHARATCGLQIVACRRVGQVLNNTEGLDRLGFTPEQRARLRRHDGNLLALLTAEQEQKLTEEAGFRRAHLYAALLSGAGSFDADQALADYTDAIRTDPKFQSLSWPCLGPGEKVGPRRGPRRLCRGPAARSPSSPRPTARGEHLRRTVRPGQGDRRLQRSHPAQARVRRGVLQSRRRISGE